MRKPYMFFDFDGLKFNTVQIHIDYINKKYGILSVASDYANNPSLETIVNNYKGDSFITSGEVYADIAGFNASITHHENVLPFDGMCEVVPLLAEKYTLLTVTARQKTSLEVIEYLLNKFIPGCISDIHCVWEHKGNGIFEGVSKKKFIESIDGKKVAFIDDSPKEILAMGNIVPSYLFDPGKIHEDISDIPNRVYCWKQIGDLFL